MSQGTYTDTQLLDWVIDRGAQILCSEDTGDGKCRVSYYPRAGGCPVWATPADTPRNAIVNAMDES